MPVCCAAPGAPASQATVAAGCPTGMGPLSTKTSLTSAISAAMTAARAMGPAGTRWSPGPAQGPAAAGADGTALASSGPASPSPAGSRPPARAIAAVRPYQARAFTSPARPATGTASGAGSAALTAAAVVSTMNSASSHHAAETGGRVRHQVLATPAWLSGSAISSMAGSRARNGQEKGRMASPKVRLTSGDISRQARVVTTSAPRRAASDGGVRCAGQASLTSAVFSADRAASSPASSRANQSQDRWVLYSQRRSWNIASGGSAVT